MADDLPLITLLGSSGKALHAYGVNNRPAILAVVAIAVAGAVFYGASRWESRTRDFRAKLAAARLPITPPAYDAQEIEELPAPVRRYFHNVLRDGQPIISTARLSTHGKFRMSEAKDS